VENKPYYTYYQDQKEEKRSQKIFIILIVLFCVAFISTIAICYAFYQNFSYITISGKSMQSTLNPNPVLVKTENGSEYLQDGVYIKHTQDIDYKDIVVIDTTPKNAKKEKTIIKRVLGLEGDYVSIVKLENEEGLEAFHLLRVKQGKNKVEVLEEEYIYSYESWSSIDGSAWEITVDGVTYESNFYSNYKDSYKYEYTTFPVSQLGGAEVVFFKIPEKSFFFLGDNRANSNDSRALGFLKTSKIEGRVVDIVKDGSEYSGNTFWWFNRAKGFFRVIWQEILYFFSASA